MDNEVKDSDPNSNRIKSLISSILDPIYDIISKLIPPSIKMSKYIWELLTILLLLLLIKWNIIYLDGFIRLSFIILLFEFVSLNIEEIKRIFRSNDNEKIEIFLKNIEKHSFDSILNFLDNYSLGTNQLKKLFKTKYATNADFHKKIIETQNIDCDFVDYIVKSKIADNIHEFFLSRYILFCQTTLNKEALDYLKNIKSLEIKGVLLVTQFDVFKKSNYTQILLKPFLFLNKCIIKLVLNTYVKLIIAVIISVFLINLFNYNSQIIIPLTQDVNLLLKINIFLIYMVISAILLKFFIFIYFSIIFKLWGFIYREDK